MLKIREAQLDTGLCVDVSPLYETTIGTSEIVKPFLLAFIRISFETPIPCSNGIISDKTFELYARNPLCESVIVLSNVVFANFVIILIPLFCKKGFVAGFDLKI